MWNHWTYLVLILIWAGPIIVLQWLLGAELLIRHREVLIPGVVLPTIYLTIADSFALSAGTWTISPAQSLNVFVPFIHVPIEEATFFLLTNILIIQAVILYMERSRFKARIGLLLTIRKGKEQVQQLDDRG